MLCVRGDFPYLGFDPDGLRVAEYDSRGNKRRPLIYLDSAATTQKPRHVIDACSHQAAFCNANINRGIYHLAETVTLRYEQARQHLADFINAPDHHQVIFTHGTTESLNLVVFGWARHHLPPGSLVVLGIDNHHSNIVPWQMEAAIRKWELVFVDILEDGSLDFGHFQQLLERRPRVVALTGMSNVSGCILDLKLWVDRTHQAQAAFVLDAAQLVAHRPLDVAACGVDFAAFSSHKLYGPTGIGILYVDAEYLQQMQPVMGGGDMIEHVDIRGFRPTATPQRFEAGTPAITQAVGLSAALDYLEGLGWSSLLTHEYELTRHIRRVLGNIRGVRPLFDSTVRDPEREGGLFSFNVEGLHPHDIAQLLDSHNIAVRAGHHCAMPLHTTLGVSGSVRVSFGVYTTTDEIDALAEALESIVGWYGNERMTPS